MTNSPNSDQETQSNANRRIWLLWLSRTGMAFGIILLVGVAAGALWAWVFVQEQLAPLVEKNLSQSLKRPVRLGKVERFSFNGLRFGASEIPATPTDPDRASVQAVEVGLNPVEVLFTRTLKLDVSLINPDVYIEQDQNNRWISTQVGTQEGTGPIKTQLQSVRVTNAKAVLVPFPKPGNNKVAVGIQQLNANAEFLDNNQRIRFNLAGQMTTGGNFNISGENIPPNQQTNLQLQGQNLLAADLDRLVKFPFDLPVGRIDGNLTVRYNPNQPLFLLGTANLNDVTAGIKQLPAPFTNANGMLRFSGQEVRLENVSAKLGQIPLQATGILNTQKGFDIGAQVPNIAISTITQTLIPKVKLPVPVVGEIKARVRLTGTIQSPILLGEFTTTKPTQVDKILFGSINARFGFAPVEGEVLIANLQAKPVAGGEITGKGQIKLGEKGGLVVDVQAQNLPADAIAPQYAINLPPSIKLGKVSAKTQVFGPLNDIRIVSRWQAPAASYPASGELLIARGQTILRNGNFKVAGRTIQASAKIADGRWEALVEGSQLPVNNILAAIPKGTGEQSQTFNPASLPLPIQQGLLTGKAKLAGSLDSFNLADIQAIAQGNLQVAGGNVQLREGILEKGRWQALLGASSIELGRFPQTPAQLRGSTFNNGLFKLAGNIDSFQIADIQAIGRGNLNIAGGTLQIQQAGIRNGNWEAIVQTNNIDLGRFAQLPPQVQSAFNGRFRLGGNINSTDDLATINVLGQGNLQVAGGKVEIRELQLNKGNWEALIATSSVQLGAFPQVPKQLQGSFNGLLKLGGNLDTLTGKSPQSTLAQIQAIAQGNLQLAGGNIQIRQAELNKGEVKANIAVAGVQLNRFPQVPKDLQGSFSGQLQFAGNLDNLTAQSNQSNQSNLAQIQANAKGNLQIAGGNIQIRQAQLNQGNWRALVAASGVQLNRFPQVPNQFQGAFNGEALLTGNLGILNTQPNQSPLSKIEAIARGNLRIAGGNVQIREAQLNQGNWRANVAASGVQLNRFPQVPKQVQGAFNGEALLAGNLDIINTVSNQSPLSKIEAIARGNLQIAGGNVQIRQAQVKQGNWAADVALAQVQLNRFSQQLGGNINGAIKVAGNIASLTNKGKSPLSNIQAEGQVNLSQGVSALQGPLNAAIQWNGQQLQIQQLSAPGLNANGVIAANFDRNNIPNITAINLNVDARDFNLKTLPVKLPYNVAVAGKVDFNGRISGTPNTPKVGGNLRLRNFGINGLNFEPVLAGDVQVAPGGGIRLNLAGNQDQIAFQLDNNYNPVAFAVRRDGTVAEGRKQGESLLVDVQNFPLATLKDLAKNVIQLPPAIATQPISGQLSGNLAVNLNQRTVVGNNVAIAQPSFGEFQLDNITANFRYANGIAEITSAQVTKGESTYGLTGRLTSTDFVAKLNIEQGRIQNVLTAFNLLNLQNARQGTGRGNLPGAADVQTVPVSVENAPLQAQLRRFSEIEALREQQRTRRQEASRIPDIQQLRGNFTGSITIAGNLPSSTTALPTGLRANFDLVGQDWQLGEYKAEKVIAEGKFENGTLSVGPLQIQLQDALLAFSGNLGTQQQSGQLQVQNFPVELLNRFVSLPVALTGKINGVANLGGTLENPQVIGNLSLAQGNLNGTPVQSAQAKFNYGNARLNFDSQVVVQQPQPILIAGSLPYQLPFSTVKPDSDRINLNVNVANEGLGLISLLSRGQIEWKSGQGQVQLQVGGTLSQPQATGIATVQNATIAAVALPETLKNVTGTIRFNSDRILVENITGQFTKGAVAAQGIIPIAEPLSPEDPDRNTPLMVSLNQLGINLKGLYRGGVNGEVNVTGTALQPIISGALQLSNGQVFLAERNPNLPSATQSATNRGVSQRRTSNTRSLPSFEPNQTEFKDLHLTLADNVNVTRQPLFSFRATGELTVNGFLGDLLPSGTISLRDGSVNLFSTQMTLDRGYEQVAEFVPQRGLDPFLNVRLVTNVPEVTGSRLPASSISSEIADVPANGFFGTIQTVRIVAKVQGLASQLSDNLELTSNPPRSESEIVALIGGGFVQNLGRGDSTLGLANLAGSAFLSNQQIQGTITAIGQAFGLSELRLFPTPITSSREDRSRNASTLGLAAEAVVDIDRKLSASVSKVLTTTQPIQYNLRYRVNNNILLRGSTDLSGDTRALLEFERRF